jgi:hypothetical protein
VSTLNPVTIYADTNVATLSGLPTIQGYTFTGGESIALGAQTDPIDRGIYDIPLGGGAWTRRADFSAATPPPLFAEFRVVRGTYARWKYYVENQSVPTPGTDAVYFAALDRGSPETDGPGTVRDGTIIKLPEQPDAEGSHGYGFFRQRISDRGITEDFDLGVVGEMFAWGMTIAPTSALGLDVYPGAAYIPTRGSAAEQGQVEDSAYTIEDAGGGALLSNTLYYVYASHFGEPVSPFYYLSPLAPVSDNAVGAPFVKGPSATPDRSRRYIQTVLTVSAGGAFHKQRAYPRAGGCFVRYIANAGAAPFLVLPSGAATSETTVSCAPVVPVPGHTAKLRVVAGGSSAVSLGNSEDGITLSNTEYLERVPGGDMAEIDMPLDANRAFTYRHDSTGGNTVISVLGYEEAR